MLQCTPPSVWPRLLSTYRYQHDAACRVIARLVKERDEARGALSNAAAYATAATAAAGSAGDAARPGITEDVLAVITNKAKLLNKSRKKRRAPDSLADETAVAGWKVRHCAPGVLVPGAVAAGLVCVLLPCVVECILCVGMVVIA